MVIAISAVVLSFGQSVSAAEFKAGDFVSFLRGTTSTGDVYAAGQSISIDQRVEGDVLAAGMNVRISGETSGSVIAAGSFVDVVGNVGHAVRAAGSRVSVDAEVMGDALLGGAIVNVPQGAVIHGDLYVGSGTAVIDGTVLGNVKIGGGQVAINGQIGGNVDATADDLTIGENSKIAGKLKYSSPKMARIMSTSSIAGGLDYTESKPMEDRYKPAEPTAAERAGAVLLALLFGLAVWLTASFVALWLFRNQITAVSNSIWNDFAKNLGWGFVWLVVVPIACIILLLTIIGSSISLFLFLVYALTILVAKVVSGMALGLWIMRRIDKDQKRGLDWKAVLLGVFVLQVVMLIPILGWIASFILFLSALGATVVLAKQSVK